VAIEKSLAETIRSASSFDNILSDLYSTRLEIAAAIEEDIAIAIFNSHLLGRAQISAEVRNEHDHEPRARAGILAAVVLETAFEPLPFDEAIDFWRGKTSVSPQEFAAMTQAARQKAFSIADGASKLIRDEIRDYIDQALTEGLTLGEFQSNAARLLDAAGITARAPHYWETVYRTNLATSYQVGRWRQMNDPAVRAARPYLRYVSARLPTSRPSHVEKHGLVYPTDHAFWTRWYPPNGFNCKCTVMSVSESLLDRRGWEVSSADVKDAPDKGFEVNAGASDAV